MSTTSAKIKEIEDEMAKTQKNKATAKHLGMLKAKLAKLKAELLAGPKSGGGGGKGDGFEVGKSGDTRIGLIGFPSVGKSTLLSKITGTQSLAAAYEFTTLTAIPGTLHYKGAKLQVMDLPGIIEGAKDGKGRGRQVIAAAKTCDVLMMVLDASKPLTLKQKIEHELEGFGIRINKKPPRVLFRRKDRGGVGFRSLHEQRYLDMDVITAVCREYRCPNAEFVAHQPNITVDQLIDVIEGKDRRAYIPTLYVLNKIDTITVEELDIICSTSPHYVPISARDEWNLDGLLQRIWDYLDIVRVYTKPRGEIPDYTSPVILKRGRQTIGDFCDKIHRNIRSQVRYAWVWGSSVKHQPQRVGLDHELQDEDVCQLVKK